PMAGSLKGTGIKGGTEAKLDTWRTLPIHAAGDRRIRPYAISWPLQYCHYQPASEGKTDLCVKRGSYRIITKQVQKWRLAARNDLSDKCTNKRGCMTTPPVSWVSAPRRNFCESIDPHSLARHGNELTRLANTEVRAKHDHPCREGTWVCQFDQMQHVG